MKTRVLFILLGGAFGLSALGQEAFFALQSRMRGVTIPFYTAGQPRAVAVLRIERLFTEYQRKQFFRIGLLPLLVGEGVQLEIQSPETALRALESAPGRLPLGNRKQPVEWRHVTLVVPSQSAPRLQAGRLRPDGSGAWRLLDGVVVQTGTNQLRWASATLHLSGDQAGQLVGDSETVVPLFGPSTFPADTPTQVNPPQ